MPPLGDASGSDRLRLRAPDPAAEVARATEVVAEGGLRIDLPPEALGPPRPTPRLEELTVKDLNLSPEGHRYLDENRELAGLPLTHFVKVDLNDLFTRQEPLWGRDGRIAEALRNMQAALRTAIPPELIPQGPPQPRAVSPVAAVEAVRAARTEPVHPNRVAVVTGGNRGMGFETCRQLAKDGFTVILTAQSPERGEAAAEQLRREGLDVHFAPLDVSSADSALALGKTLAASHGRVDVLVNNAGALYESLSHLGNAETGGLLSMDPRILQNTMQVNTLGPIMVTQALAALMGKEGLSRVINITSRLAAPSNMDVGIPAYRLAKSALFDATTILAKELEGKNITVNSVDPGWVKTDMGTDAAERTVQEGVATTAWLAGRGEKFEANGGLFRGKKQVRVEEWF